MQDICINRLDVKGPECSIKLFINDFYSEEKGFSMKCIIPSNFNNDFTWKIMNWGTDKDIFQCSSYEDVINSIHVENNISIISINYLTNNTPNEAFCKNLSKKYIDLEFSINYFEPSTPFSGKSVYVKGLYQIKLSKFYEKEKINKADSIISIYDFALKEKLVTLEEITDFLLRSDDRIKNYFLKESKKEIEIFDFNEIKNEYISENIPEIEGDNI